VEWAENQTQVSRPFHRPLKIPQTRRDLHISTAPAMMVFTEPKTKERKSAAARPPHSSVPPSLRSGGPYFMLIFRLENALTHSNAQWSKTAEQEQQAKLAEALLSEPEIRQQLRWKLKSFGLLYFPHHIGFRAGGRLQERGDSPNPSTSAPRFELLV
jgi:hypothetical protein